MSTQRSLIHKRTEALIGSFRRGEHVEYFELKDRPGLIDYDEPVVLRRTKVLETLFQEVPVRILDQELIVGIRPECKIPKYVTDTEENRAFCIAKAGPQMILGHTVPDYEMILREGFAGIQRRAQAKLKVCKEPKKINFLKAVVQVCDAVREYSKRYANEAIKLARNENDATRKGELMRIANVCKRVPYQAPSSFWEALQAVWFTHSLLRIAGHPVMGFGRFDQYMHPYYVKSVSSGDISSDEAKEFLECFFIKLSTTDFANSNFKSFEEGQEIVNDQDNGQKLMLGGEIPDGEDGTNELSMLCLDLAMELGLPEPSVQVRIHKRSPDDFILRACKLSQKGSEMPLFNNDEVIISALKKSGFPLRDARNYSNDGCNELIIPGKSEPQPLGVWVELLKCLELALNNGCSFYHGDHAPFATQIFSENYGVDMQTGDVVGPETGEPSAFQSFEDLVEAFEKQVAFSINTKVRHNNRLLGELSKVAPTPLLSVILDGCVERGVDKTEGGTSYTACGVQARGLPNVVDALAAIRTVVYEYEEMSLDKFVSILKNDFAGREDFQARLRHKMPKFGNDDDKVDALAVEIGEFLYSEVSKYSNPFGGPYLLALWASWHVHGGKQIGASADGRSAGEAIARNLVPVLGAAKGGPTAVINSVAKMDQSLCPGCATLDLDLDKGLFPGEEGTRLLAALVKTYFEQGGQQIAFNLLSAETLKDAQIHPEKYGDLVVRVWGYSAYFVHLSREYQDLVIRRLETS